VAVTQVFLLERLDALYPAVQPHLGLDMVGGAVQRHLQQRRFVVGRRHAGHGPHLGVTDLALAKSRADRRQIGQGFRNPHPLAGGAHAHAALPVQPVRAGTDALARPAFFSIELADQLQQAEGAGIEVGGQLGDVVRQVVQPGHAWVIGGVTGLWAGVG